MALILVVAGKEFRTFFQTPLGYVTLCVFTAISEGESGSSSRDFRASSALWSTRA